jgi:hypothetical protein
VPLVKVEPTQKGIAKALISAAVGAVFKAVYLGVQIINWFRRGKV